MNKVKTKNSNFIGLFINIKDMFISMSLSDKAQDKRRVEFTVDGSAFFQRFVSLRVLYISRVTINESSADMFAVAFSSNLSSLKQLCMSDCRITSKIAIKFLQQLQKNKNIEFLDLSNNLIDDEATEAMVIATLHWEDVPRLSKNKFSMITNELFELLTFSRFKTTYYQSENSYLFISILEYAKGVTIFDSSVLDKISKLQNLALIYPKQNHDKQLELTVRASEFFLRFVNLIKLTIVTIKIHNSSMSVLARAFESNLLQCLKELTLIDCGLTTETTIILMNKLRNTVNLEILELRDNHIDDDATNVIATAIFCWRSLKTLNLDDNQFNVKSIKLFRFITEHFLHFSDLSIDFSADLNKVNLLVTLLDYAKDTSLDCISKVEYLCLDCFGKRVTDKPLELTVNAAKYFQTFTDLVKLNISGIVINKQTSNMLAVAFGSNLRTLEYLLMNGCNLTSPVVKKLLKELQNAKNIKEIQLCDNRINENAFEAIAISILNWDSLEIIKLDNNKFCRLEIYSLFLILMEKESNFLTSMENATDTRWRDFYITKTFISVLEYANHHTGKRVSHFINTISKLTSLNLNCTFIDKPFDDINLELTVSAANFFSNFTNIIKLDLSGLIISEETANALCRVFDFSKLQSLQLNNCQLVSKYIVKILDILQKAKNITEFQLCNNLIDDEATTGIVMTMLHWNSLGVMKMDNNHFSNKSMNLFAFVSKTYFMWYPDKTNNTIDCKHEDAISMLALLDIMNDITTEKSNVVKSITCVSQLALNCLDDDQQITLCASTFFKRFTNLKELNLTGITIDTKAMDIIADAFASNLYSTMESLTISSCHVDSESAATLLSSLSKKSIGMLNLSNNEINNEATETINAFLNNNTTLVSINLANNYLKTETVFGIKESIVSCTSLQNFDISNNQITDDAVKYLIYLSCHLKSLKVDGNKLSDDTLKQLCSSV